VQSVQVVAPTPTDLEAAGGAFGGGSVADRLNDGVQWGPWAVDAANPHGSNGRKIDVGDDPSGEDGDVADPSSAQGIEDPWKQFEVGPRVNGQADRFNVFVQCGLRDLVGGLADSGVDDLHTGVTKCSGDDLGAAVVPVKAWLRDKNPQGERTRNSDD
jgi:hypothetical protein